MYVVFDTETGGLDPRRHALMSVAAVALDPNDLHEIGMFYTLISDDLGELDEKALAVNGLSRERCLAEGIPLATALSQLQALLNSGLPVAHNAAFDVAFLFYRGLAVPRAIDTMTWSAREYPRQPKSLRALCGRLGIRYEGAHDALVDCRLVAEVLRKIGIPNMPHLESVNLGAFFLGQR